MPAVITPQHHNRIITVRAFIKCLYHATDHGIGKGNRCEIPLYALFPLVVLLNMCEITVGPAPLAGWWEIAEIIGLVARWQLNLFNGKKIKILFRHEPRLMRSIDATGQEEWLVMLFLKLLTNPF